MVEHYIFIFFDTSIEWKRRIESATWPIFPKTKYKKKIKKDDRIAFYEAGQNGQKFTGEAMIQNVVENDDESKTVHLSGIKIWKKPVSMHDVLPDLTFIRKKHSYGMYLVGGVRKIPEEDFNLILSKVKL